MSTPLQNYGPPQPHFQERQRTGATQADPTQPRRLGWFRDLPWQQQVGVVGGAGTALYAAKFGGDIVSRTMKFLHLDWKQLNPSFVIVPALAAAALFGLAHKQNEEAERQMQNGFGYPQMGGPFLF